MAEPHLSTEANAKENNEENALRIILGARLETLLDIRGYPKGDAGRIKQLAIETDLSPFQIRKFFQTQIASPLLLSKLATLLNTSVDYLLGRTDIFDSAVMPTQDNSLIAWLWHPLKDKEEKFDIPFPALEENIGARQLKGLWAVKHSASLGHVLELVIYDPTDTTLLNGCEFLMKLDGVVQIRSIEMLKKKFARFWFHEAGLETVIHLDRLKPDASSQRGEILGKIISRVELMKNTS